jgi:hypothetical protein
MTKLNSCRAAEPPFFSSTTISSDAHMMKSDLQLGF